MYPCIHINIYWNNHDTRSAAHTNTNSVVYNAKQDWNNIPSNIKTISNRSSKTEVEEQLKI